MSLAFYSALIESISATEPKVLIFEHLMCLRTIFFMAKALTAKAIKLIAQSADVYFIGTTGSYLAGAEVAPEHRVTFWMPLLKHFGASG
ncbi:MAG: hypothetical protein P8O06_08030 [Porticoccaceae bacterium]|nr:hypothetical protein [Porticoccaceae bacterium]